MKRGKTAGQKQKRGHMEQIDCSINIFGKAAGKTLKQMTDQDKKYQNTFRVVISVNSVFHGAYPFCSIHSATRIQLKVES